MGTAVALVPFVLVPVVSENSIAVGVAELVGHYLAPTIGRDA